MKHTRVTDDDLEQAKKDADMADDEQKQELLRLMSRVMATLDRFPKEPCLRQLRLETEWLRQNLKDGRLRVPQSWQLLIFNPPLELNQYPETAAAAKELADALKMYALKTGKTSSPGSNQQ